MKIVICKLGFLNVRFLFWVVQECGFGPNRQIKTGGFVSETEVLRAVLVRYDRRTDAKTNLRITKSWVYLNTVGYVRRKSWVPE